MIDRGEARALVARLAATARPAGSGAEDDVRQLCEQLLRAAGFHVRREEFTFSAFPGRWATPLGGLWSVLVVMAVAWLTPAHPGRAVAASAAGALALALAVRWLMRRGVLGLSWLRLRSTNLIAERGTPRVWLVAHLDTKSQPVSMLLRVAGIIALSAVWLLATANAAALFVGAGQPFLAPAWVGAAAAIAALPVIASTVGGQSPGAVDDASGVAAALLVAQRLGRDRALGVLFTSAEELGLAGAQSAAAGLRGAIALNFDGLDDGGALRVMTHRRGISALAEGLRRAAAREDVPCRVSAGLPGVLTDAVALRDQGCDAVTLSAGTLRTLLRIHRPTDTVQRMTGAGIAAAATVALAALEEIS